MLGKGSYDSHTSFQPKSVHKTPHTRNQHTGRPSRLPPSPEVPLEDELGDVLDKALCLAGLHPEAAAEQAGVDKARLLDALDWRSELGPDELGRLAKLLKLNEVGLCAIASGSYPIPKAQGLPFCLYPLRMTHGIGVANAYLVSSCGSERGVLFDTGPGLEALLSHWPAFIRSLEAVFITHVEPEHAGGLCDVVKRFGVTTAFIPEGAQAPCGIPLREGELWSGEHCTVSALNTPGHAEAHASYLVRSRSTEGGRGLLIAGDLFFAGSISCPFHSREKLLSSFERVLHSLPEDTLIAPGHGPLTTVGTELRFNPFAR